MQYGKLKGYFIKKSGLFTVKPSDERTTIVEIAGEDKKANKFFIVGPDGMNWIIPKCFIIPLNFIKISYEYLW